MAKREKVILILMFLAIVGGGYSLFFTSSPPKISFDSSKQGGTKSFVTDLTNKMANKDISESSRYIISRAKAELKKDPFIRSEMAIMAKADRELAVTSVQKVDFTYSGYLNMGMKSLVVINGMDYEAGDDLEQDGYFVKNIFPTKVVIGVKGRDNIIVLPLQEMY